MIRLPLETSQSVFNRGNCPEFESSGSVREYRVLLKPVQNMTSTISTDQPENAESKAAQEAFLLESGLAMYNKYSKGEQIVLKATKSFPKDSRRCLKIIINITDASADSLGSQRERKVLMQEWNYEIWYHLAEWGSTSTYHTILC